MEWEGREESQNVDDRRGMKTGMAIGGGSLLVVLLAVILGVNPNQLAGILGGRGEKNTFKSNDPEEEKMAKFTKVVFRDTEIIWEDQFKKMGKTYQKPTLVLFSGQVSSACGNADASVGPFYCPGDSRVYIDLSFYKDMVKKLNAPGEFARAYVIAHEVGHHVQRLLGYSARADSARGTALENQMSVRLELQADYLAGVWAHHAQAKWKLLAKDEYKAAIKAAYEIGDDRLQQKARGRVVPEKFTHGTSEQRMRWFKAGFDSGSVQGASQLFDLSYNQL